MDKWQAVQSFWESFTLPAYDENAVPDNATLPYITYGVAVASFENPVLLNGDIWYRSTSWKDISQKSNQIANSLNKTIKIDHGYLYLTQGTPFAQRMGDEDITIKRITINIMAEYLTEK